MQSKDLSDAQLGRDISAHVEHTFADRRGDWRVSIAGSSASEHWEMRVEGPNGFEQTYTLASSAGEHELEAIRRFIFQLLR